MVARSSFFTSKALPLSDDQFSCSSAEMELSPKKSSTNIYMSSPKSISSTTSEVPVRRNVRFLVDTQGRESVETFEYEKPPLYCWNDLYWSDREKNEFTNAARLQVLEFVKRNHLRVRRMENAYEQCADKSASERKKREDMQSLLKWTASSGRGLEDSVSRLCWERRDAYRKDMIEFFAYLADSFVPGTDVDDEVRMFSECRTLASREFAFKLALADELTLK